jgi:hypothetical protein
VNAAAAAKEATAMAQTNLPLASKAAEDAKKALRRSQGVADAAKRTAAKAEKAKAGAESTLASISKRLPRIALSPLLRKSARPRSYSARLCASARRGRRT